MKYLFYIIILLIASSCNSLSEVKLADLPPKLVVHCILNPENEIRVYVSHTIPILENEQNDSVWLKNAKVEMWEDSLKLPSFVVKDTFIAAKRYVYYSNFTRPKLGKNYTLKVVHINYPNITAVTKLPSEYPQISQVKFLLFNKPIANALPSSDFSFNLKDTENEKNYYGVNLVTDDNYGMGAYSYALGTNGTAFSDEKFANTTYPFLWECNLGNYSSVNGNINIPKINKIYITYTSTDSAYFAYPVSLSKNQEWSSEPQLFSEISPAPTYTNIKGGYGILAAFLSKQDSISF